MTPAQRAKCDDPDIYKYADDLYKAGYVDRSAERDYDPRKCPQWQALVDLLRELRDEQQDDSAVLDWLEDKTKCYWVEVQRQCDGEVAYSGNGPALRESITAMLAAAPKPPEGV